jgi:ABC-type transport system involved in cytochrome c biogenesis permease subunit
VLAAYRSGQPEQFNARLAAFREKYDASVPAGDRARANFETFLNGFSPFYHCTATYVFAFLLALAGWFAFALGSPLAEPLRRSAFWVLLLTFVLHTFSLASRMYLMDRPLVFVTNLYSTAIFIGWAGVGGCLLVERKFPLGLGNAVGAAIGFATGILAHNLAAGGDTLEVMQAVLDDNFWLATHVTTINLGYSATYVAGLIAIGYVVLGAFTTQLRRPVVVGGKPTDLGKAFGTIMYGAICLATILSFVGTVLGGIWADQSWGRFWGWDPKENGAVLIVIWNALILHARWCGLVKDRGVAVLALVGNMVTTWSYFGTNQLGAGLHAYGFSKTLADGCTYTWIIHLGLIAVGLTPIRFWRSHVERPIAEPV